MEQQPTQIAKAALWMTGAIGSFSAMAVAGREVSITLDTFETMMYRSLVGVVIVCLVLTATRNWAQVTTRSMGLQLFRNVAHFTGQNLWFYAVTVIPLAQVFALEFTTPLWVIVLSPLVLGERLTQIRVWAALLGFAGILVVARPSPETISPGLIAAASSAIFFAFTIMTTKHLTKTEAIGCILFWLTVMQLGLGLVASGFDGDIALPDAQTAPWLVVIGLAGLLAHFCITNALAIAPATVVVPFDFVRLPVIAIIGMLMYGEPLDLWVLVGAVVIFGGNYLNIYGETRKRLA
ncbi:Riboflavin transporter [Falsiruegeria litorea R37]|uniref:Riboflavin transporter n=1 Tax=Falsiruegeria litorea R37 TaxID=1200284 RepID=A0A1Y5SCX4_9RHOB|nr:EamA family transporter [Falsiruegeria litorea]SLN37857.1 Riboflavin transporter [Falsiruegeria litorea R37]